MLKGLEAKFGQGPGVLAARWPEIIADKRLARFTEPVKLIKLRGDAGTILELKVDGPAAALIQHQADDILARANLVLGSGTVTRLRIVQGPVKPRPERDAKPKRRRAVGPAAAKGVDPFTGGGTRGGHVHRSGSPQPWIRAKSAMRAMAIRTRVSSAKRLSRSAGSSELTMTSSKNRSTGALASLRAPVDRFFEDVMVNSEDPAERDNRLALLTRVRIAMARIADFALIQG